MIAVSNNQQLSMLSLFSHCMLLSQYTLGTMLTLMDRACVDTVLTF